MAKGVNWGGSPTDGRYLHISSVDHCAGDHYIACHTFAAHDEGCDRLQGFDLGW